MRKHSYLLFALIIMLSSCAESIEDHVLALVKTADELNEKCPKMIDSETRLDGIGVKEPNTLVYNYTLVNLLSQNVDTTEFYRALWPGIISTIKVSVEMKKLREHHTTIEYFYQDKNKVPIYTFRIGPEAYN
jgi:hypothetical protein